MTKQKNLKTKTHRNELNRKNKIAINPFALQRQHPEKDQQNVDTDPRKNFCRRTWLLPPFQQALTYGQVRLS